MLVPGFLPPWTEDTLDGCLGKDTLDNMHITAIEKPLYHGFGLDIQGAEIGESSATSSCGAMARKIKRSSLPAASLPEQGCDGLGEPLT